MKRVLPFIFFLAACSANNTDVVISEQRDSTIGIEPNTTAEEEIRDTIIVEQDKNYEFTEGFAGVYHITSNIDSSRFSTLYCVFMYDSLIVIKDNGGYWYPEETNEGDTVMIWWEVNNHFLRQLIRLNKSDDDYCTLSVLNSSETSAFVNKIFEEWDKEDTLEDKKFFDYFEANDFSDLYIDEKYFNTNTRYKFIKDGFPLSFRLSSEEEEFTFNCFKKEH